VRRPTGRVFGPGPHDLLCDGARVAAVEVADTTALRRRGLLGTDGVEGALWITRCPSVHMIGMRYPVDAAVLDRDGVVLAVTTLQPWTGSTRFRRGGVATLEAAAGALAGWGVTVGRRLAVDRART
jgi:uncharacterized membrane protein (UPF0127 family)